MPGRENRSRPVGQSGSIAAVNIEVAHVRHGPAIVRTIAAQGASVKASEQPIDTGTTAGKCFLRHTRRVQEFEDEAPLRMPAERQ
jgi:hypothetical protein